LDPTDSNAFPTGLTFFTGAPVSPSSEEVLLVLDPEATVTMTAIPEPASLALLGVGGLVLLRRRPQCRQ